MALSEGVSGSACRSRLALDNVGFWLIETHFAVSAQSGHPLILKNGS